MNILATNIDTNDKKAVYRLTKSASAQIQTIEPGTTLPVMDYCLFEDTYKTRDGGEETRDVLSFTTIDGGKYSTISPTFVCSFMEIVELMDGEPFAVVITGGTSRAGRKFVDCELVCDCELDCDYNPAE